ncbi:expressed unknown protein [Seminavis robusta]|uniref:PARP-type domain-containing protein n=1 Tax=Seminavis robusta TaxID=568900 RepID=A0A9N8DXS1_9STRA|nr:expressed unknown protein [Seminavis robusta]|eukprot:Sro436_g142510.1 n/a (171) ;mRNA; f:5386-5898
MVKVTRSKMKKEDTKVTAVKAKETKTKGWNTMSHLSIKRFADSDPTLTAGAKRDRAKHPHVAVAELDPSGRATCKLCGDKITKSTLRFGLFMECHKGYRNLCTLHPECFWKHPETKKLEHAKEIHCAKELTKQQRADVVDRFQKSKKEDTKTRKETTTKEQTVKDEEEED